MFSYGSLSPGSLYSCKDGVGIGTPHVRLGVVFSLLSSIQNSIFHVKIMSKLRELKLPFMCGRDKFTILRVGAGKRHTELLTIAIVRSLNLISNLIHIG